MCKLIWCEIYTIANRSMYKYERKRDGTVFTKPNINFIIYYIILRFPIIQVRALLDRCLIMAVIRLRWVWLFVFSSLAIGSAVIILYYPKLRLPDSKNFHLFESKHLFEQYDIKYKDKLWFERLEKVCIGFQELVFC